MAKRKRLSPPDPDKIPAGLETKSRFPAGVASPSMSAPAPISAVARETAAQAALEEVTEKIQRDRDEGRALVRVPLSRLRFNYLIRDRLPVIDEEMEALIESLRARGQQTPIEVVELNSGEFGLISGWRRCKALAHLHAETNDPRFAAAQALLRKPEQSSDAYLAMVEENEIRVGLSFYERARIVVRTVENRVYDSEKEALLTLFGAASRSKRSKIKSFLTVVRALDDGLRFPQDLGERMGLQLSKALEDNPALEADLKAALEAASPQSPEAEQEVLQAALAPKKVALNPPLEPQKPEEIAPGILLKSGKGGAVTLGGPAWNDALRAKLVTWLKSELG